MNEELQKIYELLNIEQIPANRNYWLIRTESGKYFDDFIKNGYVAIGWDEFSNKKDFEQLSEKVLKERISSVYPTEKKPGYIYNQINRFMSEIKIDDMILIPSENSTQIAFGIVTQDFFTRNISKNLNNSNTLQCLFKKCIKVNWKSTMLKDNFDPYLRMLLFTHTTISDINDYKEYINRILYSSYVIDNIVHTTFNVTSNNNINATDLLKFLNLISQESIDVFNSVTGAKLSKDTIDIKLSVQSPGPIEFIGYSTGAILAVCAVSAFLFGIKLNVHLFGVIEFSVDTPGLLPCILQFIKEQDSHNEKIKKFDNEIQTSKQALKLEPAKNIVNFNIVNKAEIDNIQVDDNKPN